MRLLIHFTNGEYGTLRFYNFFTKDMFYKEILCIPIEAYLEFLINVYLNFKTPL